MKIYWIDDIHNGTLGMMARPRGNDWLEDEIKKLKILDVKLVVSLLEEHEETELKLSEEQGYCKQNDIEFVSFPIADRGVPKNLKAYQKLVLKIDQRLKRNNKVVIHCRMGIGRTSVIAAGVLLKNGYEPNSVFKYLSEVRTFSVPDTEEQVNWILNQYDNIKQP
ncbi:MAG: dual specificity protein phosphatase family protein [Calditrichota bacterium]